MSVSALDPFFHPRGVAIIGATQDPTKLGYGIANNIRVCGYPGAVHYVNPKGGRLFGQVIYPSIKDVPDPVDLAVILTPPPTVPALLQACGERGVPAVIVSSGGFRETGPEGAALEAECVRITRAFGMRMVGPNCIGIADTHLPLDTTFLAPSGWPKGDIAFISHSGAICAAIVDWTRGQGFGFSRLVSLGNQADVKRDRHARPGFRRPAYQSPDVLSRGLQQWAAFCRERPPGNGQQGGGRAQGRPV
jgi:acetate---CoA ligase (ADP-forming)